MRAHRFFPVGFTAAFAAFTPLATASEPVSGDASLLVQREQLATARELVAAGDCVRAEPAISRGLAAGRDAELFVLSAECQAKRGRLVEAIEAAANARALLAENGEAPSSKTAERKLWDRARAVDDTLGPRLARLTIQVIAPAERTYLVRLNGIELAQTNLGRERIVNPGSYEVRIETEAGPSPLRLELRDGQAELVHVVLPPVPSPPPAPPARVVRVQEPSSRLCPAPPQASSAASYVAFGLGAAGLLVGATTGVLAMSTASDLRCPDGRCSDAEADELRRNRAFATASNIGWAVAAAGLTVGVVALVTSDSKPAHASSPKRPILALRVSPTSAFLEGAVQ
jgi:hypothetical protein